MNRKYKVEDWLKIVLAFRKEIPDLALSTDIIVGFPEETPEDFLATFNLIKEINPNQMNMSKFWLRKGTEAEKMNQVPVEIAKNRATKLAKMYNPISVK